MKSSRVVVRNVRRGFSLLELLIVLAILGVIAAMVAPNLLGTQQRANVKITKGSIAELEKAAKLYAVDHGGKMPQGKDQEAFELMMAKEDEDGKPISPIMPEIIKDAWGQPLHYEYPSTKFSEVDKPAIWSNGENNKDEQGSGDDVTNWEVK